MIEIRVEPLPDQKFSTIFEQQRVTVRLLYNVTGDFWTFDLSIDDLPKVTGRRIVTGVDMLAPFSLGLGLFFAAVVTSGAVENWQGMTTGGVRLYHATQAEFDAAVS